jgi:plastocyanin
MMWWTGHKMTKRLFLLLTAVMLLLSSGCATSSGIAELVAENNAFNRSTIRVLTGKEVSFAFENRDNTAHNFAVYDTREAKQVIFGGDALSGPGTITYTFAAPDRPGTYYFQCDFHPSTMNGFFVVGGTAS